MKKFFSFLLVLFVILKTGCAREQMEKRVRSVPPEITKAVFSGDESALPRLVKYLTSDANSAASRVKALHDWICDNISYDSDVAFFGADNAQDVSSVLQSRKAVCLGYVNLMNRLCELSGIESRGIAGFSKGFAYKNTVSGLGNHAWNAVKLGQKWQLIDVMLDAGFCDMALFVKHYSSAYLSLTPEEFFYSHYPLDASDQLLSPAKTAEEFKAEPFIPAIFFQYGFSFTSQPPKYLNNIENTLTFSFKNSDPAIVCLTDAYSLEKSVQTLENSTWIDRDGVYFSAFFDVADKKKYRARLLARKKNENTTPMFFSEFEWEDVVLPTAQELLEEERISYAEYDFLVKSYVLVSENARYYYIEDTFDKERINAVQKVLNLAGQGKNFIDMFYFDIQAAPNYAGYGNKIKRFPTIHAYNEVTETLLVEPRAGTLKKGSEQHFVFKSSDYSDIGLLINGSLVPLIFDEEKKEFALTVLLPTQEDELSVFASKNQRNYSSIMVFSLD